MITSWDDYFASSRIPVTVTVRDPGHGVMLHRHTECPKGTSATVLDAFADLLGSLIEFTASDPYPYSAAAADAIRARFASDAHEHTEPKWRHVYAERAAVAIYNHHKETVCMIDRASRYGRSAGPKHLLEHHRDYCGDSLDATMPRLQVELLQAARALTALRIGQPDVTDAEIAMQILDALLGALDFPHSAPLADLQPNF
ncbi:hypothetical protein [Azohydromonas sp.]|mgnify:CR=1 FL=1|uniref:hypothetical protein n=1 Tax=Azohydromonas sp. TaxID=1872666 RepID=UPI002CD4D067|nr:hypothetical protein [Azohydromonas sp.]HMM84659.1 hypothetical protein [Azohydromonas sp.]